MRNFIISLSLCILYSCNASRKTTVNESPEKAGAEVRIPEPAVYRAAYTRSNDLVHTKLEVKFDWEKKQLNGNATITLHPHFYATDSLVLNARGMDLHEVSLVKKDGTKTKIYLLDC